MALFTLFHTAGNALRLAYGRGSASRLEKRRGLFLAASRLSSLRARTAAIADLADRPGIYQLPRALGASLARGNCHRDPLGFAKRPKGLRSSMYDQTLLLGQPVIGLSPRQPG